MALKIANHKTLAAGLLCVLVAGFLYLLNSWIYQDPDTYFQQIENRLQREMNLAEAEMELVLQILSTQPDDPFSELPADLNFQYYIYRHKVIGYWSDYHYVPKYENLDGNYKYRLLSLSEGQFIVLKKEWAPPGIPAETYELFMLLPLLTDVVQDGGHSPYNQKIFTSADFRLLPPDTDNGAAIIYSEDGLALFQVKIGKDYMEGPNPLMLLVAIFLLTAAALLVISLYRKSRSLLLEQKIASAFGLLIGGLLLLRALMLFSSFPYSLYPFPLFDPKYYASSFINPSLGDFLLNALSFLLIIVLLFQLWHGKRYQLRTWMQKREGHRGWIVGLAILHFALLFCHYWILHELFFHAQYSLDITSSLSLNGFKIVSWVIFCLLTFVYIFLNYVLSLFLHDLLRTKIQGILWYVGLALVLLIIGYWWPILRFVALTLALYFLVFLYVQRRKLVKPYNYQLFVYIFCSALISALAGSLALYDYHQQNRQLVKERFANQLLTQHDPVGEYLLSEAAEEIQDDPFIRSRFFSPLFSKEGTVQKVKQQYLTRYFDKYEVRVLLFNVDGSVINHPNRFLNYHVMRSKAEEGNNETDYPDLYLLDEQGPGSPGKRYQQFIPVLQGARPLGYIVIDLTQKRFLPNTVYPELFFGQRLQDPQSARFNYAIFSNGRLDYNVGAFDYVHHLPEGILQDPGLYQEGIEYEGYHHLGVKDQRGQVVVVSDPSEPGYFVLSNFSFLFLLGIFLVSLGLIGYVSFYGLSIKKLDFTTKIQLYLNFAVFLPLLVVSVTTLSLINSSFKEDKENQYYDKAENISRNLAEIINDRPFYQLGDGEELSNTLASIARYAEVDIHLFNTQGRLAATNQPIIYQQDYLAPYINPLALAEIKEQNSRQIILNERVNTLRYKSAYMAVRSTRDGSLLGILSLPFFESGYQLEQQLAAVFSNIVNIFACLFILFLGLLYLLSRELTEPLRYIAQKMKQVSLSGKNEPLHWPTDDEIGKLIREYNLMLANLQESKEALSRSEKESAWREMAKQVAHEIKNPLTPMKLSLQHMSRMLRDKLGSQRDEELVQKSVNSMLDQIDTLSDIATSFSAFAKMPIPKQERFDVADVLKGVLRLYANQQQQHIQAEIEPGRFWVLGDEQMMQRTFHNLILNGIQSVPDTREPVIKVSLQALENGRILIEISDNGEGIEPAIREKVFVPNFSTKYTGSGLGLAIAKRGIEHAGGSIWFETEAGVGTSFYIELPLAL